MVTIDEIQKWITLVSSVIAAGASLWSLWAKLSENNNKIKVSFGSLKPAVEPGYWLHVISKSNHVMFLKDYGFIDESGRLLSLPQLFSDEPESNKDVFVRGKSFFEQCGDIFETGAFELRDKQIGAFAITAGQKCHTLCFGNDTSLCQQLWIRLKVWWKTNYQII